MSKRKVVFDAYSDNEEPGYSMLIANRISTLHCPLAGWVEFQHQKTCLQKCVPCEDSDQPTHSRSLIRIFTGGILESQGCCIFMRTMKTMMSAQKVRFITLWLSGYNRIYRRRPKILITKTRLFKYIENLTTKNWKFSDRKNLIFFYISAQNIDCGYSLEPPAEAVLTSTHNLCFKQK